MDSIVDENIEKIRYSYKPNKVRILLVGESAPAAGNFFYLGDSLCNYTKSAFAKVYPEVGSQTMQNFLDFFKEKGFYLDDLCLMPIDKLDKKQRRQCIKNSVQSLAERIKMYSPIVVISMLKSIKTDVLESVHFSGVNAQFYSLPFGGNGHQNKYIDELSEILKNHGDIEASHRQGGSTGTSI